MLEPGFQLGKYTIVDKLGAGGMADVYLAEDTTLQRQVALKVLPPEFARDAERAERFKKEVLHCASLQHPGIVTIYDVGHDQGTHYYTMSLLNGGDLKQKISEGLPPQQALQLLRQIAEGLGYAHAKGFVHRDLKPENIMFDDHGKPVITDFGIAKAIGSGTKMTGTGMSIGTPHYMSPEQARGKPVDGRSDLYALGIVLFEMLTGQVPFQAEDTFAVGLMHINDPVPQLPPNLAKLQPLIDRLLAKSQEERYPNAAELVSAIDRVLSGQKLPDAPKTQVMPKVEPEQQKGSGLKWALGGALLAVLVVGGFMQTSGDGKQKVVIGGGGGGTAVVLPQVKQKVDEPVPVRVAAGKDKVVSPDTILDPPPARHNVKEKAEVNQFLSKAEEALRADRMTVPEGECAVYFYRKVLDKEPQNQKAKAGLEKVANRYFELAERALQGKDLNKARKYNSKGAEILNLGEEDTFVYAAIVQLEQQNKKRKYNAAEGEAKNESYQLKSTHFKYYGSKASTNLYLEKQGIAYDQYIDCLLPGDRSPVTMKASSCLVSRGEFTQMVTTKLRSVQQKARKNKPDFFTDPTTGMEFVLVKGGCYQMGSTSGDNDEKPLHEVCVDDFYMGKYEVTQNQYQQITGSNPSQFKGSNRPVEKVSWHDAQTYIKQLNTRGDSRIAPYRLPTEAEWEYAARSGGRNETYAGSSNVDAVAWYDSNSGSQTHPVGQKQANGLGLYDMSGNVWEWCSDRYGKSYYNQSPRSNPQGPSTGSNRVDRGGSWVNFAGNVRAAHRGGIRPGDRNEALGFRLVLPTVQ